MGKNLYRVKVVLYVMAENESDACFAATQAQFDIYDCNAKKAEKVSPEWSDAIPYNADEERTCSEIMAAKQAVPLWSRPGKFPHKVGTGTRKFKSDKQSVQLGQRT
jgi:hypothetical protein